MNKNKKSVEGKWLETIEDSLVFFNREFIQEKHVRISPHDRGFMFADGVYEVIRSYQGKLFNASGHIKRLEENLEKMKINYLDLDEIESISNKLISENGLSNCHSCVYIQITRGVFNRLHPFPLESISPTVYIKASGFDPLIEEQRSGVNVITVNDIRWARCDIKSIALLPNVLARQEASDNGAFEAIFVRNGAITEGTRSNVFAVKNEVLYTHPQSDFILPGITRDVVIDLAKKLNIKVEEIAITEDKLFEFDEFFLVGTSMEITPIISINQQIIHDGNPGPTTKILLKSFNDLISKLKSE